MEEKNVNSTLKETGENINNETPTTNDEPVTETTEISDSGSADDITDEELLRQCEDIHEKFDAAFRILFGDNYRALERGELTFECDDKRFYVSMSPAIGNH